MDECKSSIINDLGHVSCKLHYVKLSWVIHLKSESIFMKEIVICQTKTNNTSKYFVEKIRRIEIGW